MLTLWAAPCLTTTCVLCIYTVHGVQSLDAVWLPSASTSMGSTKHIQGVDSIQRNARFCAWLGLSVADWQRRSGVTNGPRERLSSVLNCTATYITLEMLCDLSFNFVEILSIISKLMPVSLDRLQRPASCSWPSYTSIDISNADSPNHGKRPSTLAKPG